MIADEQQHRAAKAQARRLEQALQISKSSADPADPHLRRAIIKGIRAQIEELHEEVAEYERLKASTVEDLELGALNELPLLLIRARVAQGLTRKDLAGRLGIAEQQIQHFESTNNASANLRRVLKIVRALGIDLREPAQLRQVDAS